MTTSSDAAGQRDTAGVTFTSDGLRRGARVSVPLLIGLAPFGLVAGVTAQAHGLSLLEAVLMSGLVFAGSAQLVSLGSWTHPASLATATLACLIVNLRFALMGPMLAPWLDHVRGWKRWGSLALLVEHDWALALKEMQQGGRDAAFFIGAGIGFWVVWVLTTIAGFLVGEIVAPAAGHPLFFAALACFIAMLVPMWRGTRDLLPWIAAAATAVTVSRALPGTSWHIVAGAIVGGLVGYFRDRVAPA
jgi:predicted branched-subunit amino acid permease